jgi:class 3 adenylate cyclase/tetratricopeptide (TPR) repeat protein
MLVCPSCGRENPEGFRFCGFCTAPLEREFAVEREERKFVSVIFCDLVGFTDRSDRADPEDVRATLRPYHARVRKEIERFGGTVEKFVGDAVMAVFGAPVSHEDDAERAVRAALRILDAIDELNDELGLGLSVRAAVNTGEALVTLGARPEEGEGIVAGDVVNTAARLQEAAPTGGIVVSELTRRATRHQIEYQKLDPVTVKGKAAPVPIWRALTAKSRFGVDVEQPVAAPLVGREHELALLKDTWARALREPSLQLVTVTGEPGVGKSRLVNEFRAFVDEQPELVWWRQGRCLPYGDGITFWALGEVVKAQAGILESDAAEEAARKIAAAVESLIEDPAEREWFEARLAPLVGAERGEAGSTERGEAYTAWRRFLEALASRRPFVVVLEDLHWADDALLEFVEHLVDWATGVPLVVLCTARPELYERRPGWGGGKRNSTTISLPPLTSHETAQLISALLSRSVLPVETHTALLERSGGNPLYAEEFVRMLGDRSAAPDTEAPVPETVQALIAARLDTLSPARKALLHDAAVVGKVFWLGAVASIGGREEQVVREGLHELVRKELVRPARTSSVQGDEEFSFWHVLVRDVAYQQIPRAERARRHRAAADWIEHAAGDRAADQAEILVHHYESALEYARTSGDASAEAELVAPLVRFLVDAGDRAIDLDVSKADASYRRALDLLAEGDRKRPRIAVKAARAASLAGRFKEAESLLEQAIVALRAENDRIGEAEAMISLSRALGVDETARASSILQEAVEILERETPGPVLVCAYSALAENGIVTGTPDEALRWSEKALSLAEEFDLEELFADALEKRGAARAYAGDVAGLDDLREGLRLQRDLGVGADAAISYNTLSLMLWPVEGPAKALELRREGIEFAERRGLIGNAMWMKYASYWMLHDLGEWDEYLQLADEVDAWHRGQLPSYPQQTAARKAIILLRRGQISAAEPLVAESLPAARESGQFQALVPALAAAMLLEHARGNLTAAAAFAIGLEASTRAAPAWNRFSVAVDVVRVAAAAGDLELGERMLERPDESARTRHSVVSGRAILAEAHGRYDEAARTYAEAAERWRDFGFVYEEAQALLGQGRCLAALGRGASGPLEEARKLFEMLGARTLLAETDALLAHVTAASA